VVARASISNTGDIKQNATGCTFIFHAFLFGLKM
jgi:hypothetical protein